MFALNQMGSYSKYLRYMPKTTIIELNVGKYALLYVTHGGEHALKVLFGSEEL